MSPTEIRAIRGSLSRAAFARLLGVTSLTVLRWELPEESKEARRPRALMIEALRRVAAEGVPTSAPPRDGGDDDDDDDSDDASEPASASSSVGTHPSDALPADATRVQDLLAGFAREGWGRAEQDLFSLLASGQLESDVAHALASLGLAQAQLLRLDVRSALATIMPVLAAADRGSLPRFVRGYAHVMAALAFGASDARTFDAGRVNAHAAVADELLEPDAHDPRVLTSAARVNASRRIGARVMLRAYEAEKAVLARAVSPLARYMAEEVHARVAHDRGDLDAANRHSDAAIAFAERLGVEQNVHSLLADRAWRLLRAAVPPDAVLAVTQRVRLRAREAALPTTIPFVRALAYEAEALCRSGRYTEALEVLREALSAGQQAGVLRYATATPAVHLFEYIDSPEELLALADAFEKESAGAPHPNAGHHAVFMRLVAANLKGEDARVVELAEQILTAPEGAPGIDEFIYDVWFELIIATMSLGDRDGWRDRIARFEAFLLDRPSVWHTGLLRRVEGFACQLEGRIAEARQKQEATRSTFALTGDIAQIGFANLTLAVAARAAGAPDADQQLADALAALQGMNVAPRKNLLAALQRAARATHYIDQTMAERLVVSIERLALRGLSPELAQGELRSVIALLLPGHDVVLHESAPAGESVEVVDNAGVHWHVQINGSLSAEQRAALRVVAMVTTANTGAFERASSRAEFETDARIPGFIAVAPATRRLKAEIAQLSRSSATILISGESDPAKKS